MAKVTCKYFTNVLSATRKESELFEIPDGITVEAFLDIISAKYGSNFSKHVYAEGTLGGKTFKTPNIHLNKKRIQWTQDFPEGLKTKVEDGDEFWFGLIVGGGIGQG